MFFQGIAFWQQLFDVLRASFDFKKPVTGAAEEMMVMAGWDFPARRLPGQINLGYLSLFLERFKVPVDRGYAQFGHASFG